MPIFALFKVDDQDKVVPGMLTSASYNLSPERYQVPLNESTTVNLANVVLTHLDSLKMDLKKRNVVIHVK